ncbi:Lrp/AsnC family transcriptional regulator [Haladaptatus sp. DYF46]|uniref:Lrp/AsnC family transcriptional regulator n=1 Tax=Haladaptatus sp. DYF46 TaxID=2886041 RepID=UPI001E3BACD1|nr:Lrp/AsnC family transcriptional regulator [Haladaptatus sp. DYF46]
MGYRLDEIDKRIIYYLMQDARDTSAPTIADEVNVSAGTIRNRISQLQENGIITGYHANIDFEQADGRLQNLFYCTIEAPLGEKLAQQILEIPGVINIRELTTGRGNIHVKAVGDGTADLSRIAYELTNCGLEIEKENLIQNERYSPYQEFGPDKPREQVSLTDLISLSGKADIVEVAINPDAPVAHKTLREIGEEGLIDENLLVIAIERDESVLTPKGNTRIQPNDVVTIFSRTGISDQVYQSFTTDDSDHQVEDTTK